MMTNIKSKIAISLSLFFLLLVSSWQASKEVKSDPQQEKKEEPVENVYITMEAEDELAEDDVAFIKVEDEKASQGAFIEKPDGTTTLSFTITKEGLYKLWGRAYAKNGNADSFVVELIDDNNHEVVRGTWNNINDRNFFAWDWDEITQGGAKDDTPMQAKLAPGNYKLLFEGRDADDCHLDKVLITDDLNFTPEGTMLNDKEYLTLEAEDGLVTPPFKISTDGEETYTWVEASKVAFRFNIEHSGTYKIFAYVFGENGASDSFFASVDESPKKIWAFSKTDKIWNKWKWIEYNQNTDKPETVHFSAGNHTLHIIQREKGAKMDAIMITDDLNFTPPAIR